MSNIVSFDFSYSFDSRDLLIVMYIAIAIAAILLLVAFIWFICKADSLNPNEDDGDEAQTWEDLAEENRKTVKALKLIMTGIMSLYLPVSRTVFQILACSDNIVSVAQVRACGCQSTRATRSSFCMLVLLLLLQEAGVSKIEFGDCWAWDKYAIGVGRWVCHTFHTLCAARYVAGTPFCSSGHWSCWLALSCSCPCSRIARSSRTSPSAALLTPTRSTTKTAGRSRTRTPCSTKM